MKLPDNFLKKMKNLLKDEFDVFEKSFYNDPYKGLRINTLKTNSETFEKISPFNVETVNWSKEGYYIPNKKEVKPGKHPYYHCGLYYIQEPSAMLSVEVLNPNPGDKVLDICAAPGGKSTQICAKMKNRGVVISNDINPKRTIALLKNIEMFGITNCVVTNTTPEKLEGIFEGYFDKILIDAPCSGEGMFRKDVKNVKKYKDDGIEDYCNMQKNILNHIPKMLKPGGKIVYSTCTFSPEENEGIMNWFINEYPQFKLLDIDINDLENGRPDWINGDDQLSKSKRAWPHKLKGEGHFIALLEKTCGEEVNHDSFRINSEKLEPYYEFVNKYDLPKKYLVNVHYDRGKLYLVPEELINLNNIKTLNIGMHIGNIKNNRFIPSQALALSLKINEFNNSINISSADINAIKYLKGETLLVKGTNGWKLVCIDEFSAGWAKQNQNMLKNCYKSEWRML